MHDPFKHFIDGRKDFLPASEILRKIFAVTAFGGSVGIVFFKEQIRPRLSETVNALLYISYHKPVKASCFL